MKFLSRFFGRDQKKVSSDYVAEYCQHSTKLEGEVRAFGDSTTTHMPLNERGTTNWCLDCIGKMAIRCAWCGEPIFIGDPVTLYIAEPYPDFERSLTEQGEFAFVEDTELGFRIPAHAVIYKRKPLQLVGCLRRNCAESGIDRAGFWMPGTDGKGGVKRVKTGIEQMLSEDKESLIIDDLRDPTNAVLVDSGIKCDLSEVRVIR